MSHDSSVGGTLAGGIQDIAALLPIIGTEQCETHVGSALKGGYLYAAATPLSIFGSLGIVKSGVSILFCSISICIPKLSISFRNFKPTINRSKRVKWLGSRMFYDAGFKLTGSVAPLIGMDGQRFKAEMRLLEILNEKHIDNPAKLSVDWKSRQWNIMLVLSTLLSVTLSFSPYIALLLGPEPWRPVGMHLPWLYPALRIIGSCFATISCQVIIQSRVISLMKNRILFMIIDRQFNDIEKVGLEARMKDAELSWDPALSTEECIWNLQQYFSSFTQPVDDATKYQASNPQDFTSLPAGTDFEKGNGSGHTSGFNEDSLHCLQKAHFPSPTRDLAFVLFSWIILALSLPVTVVGYIGCFTLVSAIPARANGPLVWVGLEAALSILRIVVWASNPSFDEMTDITLKVELSEHLPMVTTDEYNPFIPGADPRGAIIPFALIPQHQFLEWITPFTGPLDQFQTDDNISLYFTLTTDYGLGHNVHATATQRESLYLLMTVFDLDMQVGSTLVSRGGSFQQCDAVVKYNTISRQMEVNIQSELKKFRPSRSHDNTRFNSLTKYYRYIVRSITQRDRSTIAAILPWKWDLSHHSLPTKYQAEDDNLGTIERLPELTIHDVFYLNRGYEHQLKTELIREWGQGIVTDMQTIRLHTQNDCYEASRKADSVFGKWELTELDAQVVWEWARREIDLLNMSMELEDVLREKLESSASEVAFVRTDMQLKVWMLSEFMRGQQKRLEQERREAEQRMEEAMNHASEQAAIEGRPWLDAKTFQPRWTEVVKFMDQQWVVRIQWAMQNRRQTLKDAENGLEEMIGRAETISKSFDSERHDFLVQFKQRLSHAHWRPQRYMRSKMAKATIERIRGVPLWEARSELTIAYRYPVTDIQAAANFVRLLESTTNGKACSAIVYDALGCPCEEVVLDVIAKQTTRSVVNVNPEILSSIPSNDHLFFLSCRDKLEGNDLFFIQRNRDRWWNQQTTNCSTFYYTPKGVASGDACYTQTETIAHILVFLTAPSSILIRLLHRGNKVNNVFIQEDGVELVRMSTVSPTFKFNDFRGFVLESGRHELHLISQVQPGPENMYSLRDISVQIFT